MGSRLEDQGLQVKNSLMPLCLCLSVPPGKRAHYFSARDRITQDGASLPILGPGASTSCTGGTDPWLPELSGGGAGPEGKREGD